MLHYILFIKYFIWNITKNINFENSYFIEICLTEIIWVYFFFNFNNVHNYIYLIFKV
jgi:hypothetical protein